MKYTYASLGVMESMGFRIGGPGLGNILFPWAKSLIYSKKYKSKRIQTTWKCLKIGPLLRREKDNRLYWNLFIEKDGVSGFRKFMLLNFSRNIRVFNSMNGLFSDFLQEHQFVKDELLSIVQPKHLFNIRNHNQNGIGVHVRLGDFTEDRDETSLRSGEWNHRIPIKWYIQTINKVRHYYQLPVYVFSDGSDDELKELLLLKNCKRVHYGSSISDMIALSRNKLIISSSSTFSMWASFLGQRPTIWFPNQHRQKIILDNTIFEGEIDYQDPVPSLLIKSISDA